MRAKRRKFDEMTTDQLEAAIKGTQIVLYLNMVGLVASVLIGVAGLLVLSLPLMWLIGAWLAIVIIIRVITFFVDRHYQNG